MSVIPYVVRRTGRGEQSFDLYSRLLADRIIFLGEEVSDARAEISSFTSTVPEVPCLRGLRSMTPCSM